MEKLNYDVIKKVGYDGYLLKEAPEKVMQFGEGNFCVRLLITGSTLQMKKRTGMENAVSSSRSHRG